MKRPSPWVFTLIALGAFVLSVYLYLRLEDPFVLIFGLLFAMTTFARPLLARMPVRRALLLYLGATLGYLALGITDFFSGSNPEVSATMMLIGLLALWQSRTIMQRIENKEGK